MEIRIKKWEKPENRELRRIYLNGIKGDWYIANINSASLMEIDGACEAYAKWLHGAAREDRDYIVDLFIDMMEAVAGWRLTCFDEIWEALSDFIEMEL